MRETLGAMLIAMLIFGLTFMGCDVVEKVVGVDEPETVVEVHDNSGEVTVNVTDDDVDVSVDDGNDNEIGTTVADAIEDCCDEEELVCYSIPSGGIRECEGCTLGDNCTTDPEDPLIDSD